MTNYYKNNTTTSKLGLKLIILSSFDREFHTVKPTKVIYHCLNVIVCVIELQKSLLSKEK